MKRIQFGSIALAVLLGVGCNNACSLSGPRHVVLVSAASAEGVLNITQSTIIALKCGAPTAPADHCISDADQVNGGLSPYKTIHTKLSKAYGLDADVVRIARATPKDAPTPPQIATLIGEISVLVNDIIALIPDGSPQKAKLVASVTTH